MGQNLALLASKGGLQATGMAAGGISHILLAVNHYRNSEPLEGSRSMVGGAHLFFPNGGTCINRAVGVGAIVGGGVQAFLSFERGDYLQGTLATLQIPMELGMQWAARNANLIGKYATRYGIRLASHLHAVGRKAALSVVQHVAKNVAFRAASMAVKAISGPVGIALIILDIALIIKDLFQRGSPFAPACLVYTNRLNH